MRLLFCINLILSVAATTPARAGLTVVVRDTADRALAGVQIVVRAAGSHVQLASAQTDTAGSAWFGGLPPEAVRVAVHGALPDGTSLRQAGADADGVLLLSAAGSVQLELRVEPDGQVIPDPATMIAPDLPKIDALQAATETVAPRASAPAPHSSGAISAERAAGSPVPAWALPLTLCCIVALLLFAGRRSAR
jgi:hypothetical protein